VNDVILTPKRVNLVRYYLILVGSLIPVMTFFAIMIVEFNRVIHNHEIYWDDFLFSWLASCIGGLIGGMVPLLLTLNQTLNHISITFKDGCVFGPVFWGSKSFSINELDKTKTAKHSFFEKLFGIRSLWSIQGIRLLFYESIYDKDQINKCLEMLSLDGWN
jgi:hypothetical protein